MDRAELIRLASPPCHVCSEPIQRVEMRYEQDTAGEWRVGPTFTVCPNGHRHQIWPVNPPKEAAP